MQEFFNDDEDIEREVDDIISQIKNQKNNPSQEDTPTQKISKEDLEAFVIEKAAEVVQRCSNILSKIEREAIASIDPKIMDSVSGLANATTAAINSLTKLKIAEDKNKNQKDIAKLNLENKTKKDEEEKPKGHILTRDEVMKFLTQGLDQPS